MDASPPTTPEQRAAIDASLRGPVLALWVGAVAWLLAAAALDLAVSIQAHSPAFLCGSAWLGAGRLALAAEAAWRFGWAAPGGFGAALWVLARLGGAPLPRGAGWGVIGAALGGNIALLAGVVGLLGGQAGGVPGLELPARALFPLLLAHAALGGAAAGLFILRRPGPVEAAQLYLAGAALWYPASHLAALAALVLAPGFGTGAVGGIMAAWVDGGFLFLWLTPLGLGLLYYLLPKVLGRPVASGATARFGFWMLALGGGWAGAARLAGGPFPAWLPSLGIAAQWALVLPVIAVALTLLPLLRGAGPGPLAGGVAVAASPALRFALCALAAFLAGEAERIGASFRSVSAWTRLTAWEAAWDGLALQGFATLALFAAFYYIAPRLTGREWPSLGRLRLHFWGAALGVGLGTGALALGGAIEGLGLRDGRIPFSAVVSALLPFLWMRTGAAALFLAATGAFAFSFAGLLRRPDSAPAPASSGPLLFPVDTAPGDAS